MKLNDLIQITEAEADSINESLKQAIKDMTSKGKKYVTMKALQDHMGKTKSEFKEMIEKAWKSNRHSNQYIFTTIDDEPAVGITAAKRKGKSIDKVESTSKPEDVSMAEPTDKPEAIKKPESTE